MRLDDLAVPRRLSCARQRCCVSLVGWAKLSQRAVTQWTVTPWNEQSLRAFDELIKDQDLRFPGVGRHVGGQHARPSTLEGLIARKIVTQSPVLGLSQSA